MQVNVFRKILACLQMFLNGCKCGIMWRYNNNHLAFSLTHFPQQITCRPRTFASGCLSLRITVNPSCRLTGWRPVITSFHDRIGFSTHHAYTNTLSPWPMSFVEESSFGGTILDDVCLFKLGTQLVFCWKLCSFVKDYQIVMLTYAGCIMLMLCVLLLCRSSKIFRC